MFISPKNTDLLLIEAQNENLYLKLIEQLSKDLTSAKLGVIFPMSISPN